MARLAYHYFVDQLRRGSYIGRFVRQRQFLGEVWLSCVRGGSYTLAKSVAAFCCLRQENWRNGRTWTVQMPSLVQKSGTPETWFALIVRYRHDKSVLNYLSARGIEFFAPTCTEKHRWSRGTTLVELPVFPGCVFVHIPRERLLDAISVPGVAHAAGVGDRPYAIPDRDIEALQRAVERGLFIRPAPYVSGRRRKQVMAGPMAGTEATAVRQRGTRTEVVISIEALQQSAVIKIPAQDPGVEE
jgi:transcriptional antiterminator NusG